MVTGESGCVLAYSTIVRYLPDNCRLYSSRFAVGGPFRRAPPRAGTARVPTLASAARSPSTHSPHASHFSTMRASSTAEDGGGWRQTTFICARSRNTAMAIGVVFIGASSTLFAIVRLL